MAFRASGLLRNDGLRQLYLNNMGYRQIGLQLHDLIGDSDELREATRRLPVELKDERDWRIKRSFDLTMKKIQLPKDEWTSVEEDVPYMTPYLDDVRREALDRFELHPAD